MNIIYTNEKKYITIEQIISIVGIFISKYELEAFNLLKPFINYSTVKIEDALVLFSAHV